MSHSYISSQIYHLVIDNITHLRPLPTFILGIKFNQLQENDAATHSLTLATSTICIIQLAGSLGLF